MANSVDVQPIGNSVELSTFDVYTTSYFLSVAQTTDEHKEVKPDEL